MTGLLPNARKMQVLQAPGRAPKAVLDKLDQLIIIIPQSVPAKLWKSLPDGARLQALSRKTGADKTLRSRLANPAATGIVVGRLPATGDDGAPLSPFELLGFAGKLVAAALQDSPRRLGVLTAGLPDDIAESVARAFVLAAVAHSFQMPDYRSKPKPVKTLSGLKLLGLTTRIDMDRTLAEADAANLARWLTRMPPNKLNTGAYREALQALAKTNGWKMDFLGEARLKKLGAGAFLAVTQGNPTRDAGIVHLRYTPSKSGSKKNVNKKDQPALALVGKGIIFDTGGTNLKPFKSMLDMHEDMNGSAVAVATLQALTAVNYPFPVDCWLAITENLLSHEAYKSRDIVTAANGTTIEVIHTDAEGRMALADALALAGREKPGLILDYATLTGACYGAVSPRYSGVFSNRAALNPVLIDAGVASGERVWPFPMDADFDTDLKSSVADVVQCSVSGEADHILASRFLSRFVPKESPWVHVDLSAVSSKSGLAQMPAGVTGFGVRFTLNLLLDQADAVRKQIGANTPVGQP
jgi:leucyl aminopeptidase